MTLFLVFLAMQAKDYRTTNLKEFLAQFRKRKPMEDTSQSRWTIAISFFSFSTAIMHANITIFLLQTNLIIQNKCIDRQSEFIIYNFLPIYSSFIHGISISIMNLMEKYYRFIIVLALFALTLSESVSATNPICAVCHDIVRQFQKTIPQRPADHVLDVIGTQYCTRKHLQSHSVCKGAVTEMVVSIANSLFRHFTDPHSVCHKIRLCPKQYKVRDLSEEIKQILSDKPNKEWQKPTNRKYLKVMHISDLHPDLFYTVGAPAKCSEPVCCRSNVTMKLSAKDAWNHVLNGKYLETSQPNDSPANYWGSLNSCDLPFQTFDLFVKQVAELNPDLILWTGDNTPHDVWQQTQSYNLNFTIIISEKLKKATKAKVIGAMGNHESFPVNVYDYEGEREKMLIAGLAQTWRPWLTPQAYDMLRTKGYFSIVIPEFNNLKIISVNTQAQNDQNWFLLRDPTDAGGMLKWIESQLKESQKKDQKVHIIGHISPTSALNDWSMRFNALTERYSYTIRGQFYGHTHSDHVGLFQSLTNKTNLAAYYLIAPSLTTYSDKHPEYRVMTVDYDTLQVVDYEQYRLDLKKYTKKEDKAKFELFYRFRQAYKLNDMTIRGGMTQFKNKLQTDSETQIKYTYLRGSGTQPGKAGKFVYCDTMTSPQNKVQCQGGTFKLSGFEKVAGKWKDLQHKE